MYLLTLLAASGLALVHLLAGHLSLLRITPRSIWLSAAGGISVSYVFLHLLPELADGQAVIEESTGGFLSFLEHHAYLLALSGLALFYGLERAAKKSRSERAAGAIEDVPSPLVFAIHIVSFSLYNMLVGYLLVHQFMSLRELGFFFFAMAVHFLVNDYGLREHYKSMYAWPGRWILSLSVLLGLALGLAFELSELAISMLVAFLAGGIILNVLKEELPEERQSRFSAFLIGSVLYSTLLLAI